MHRQWKFILIAVAIGIISVLAPWAIISALGTDVDIESFHKWKIPALIVFVAVSGIIYALLSFIFRYKKSNTALEKKLKVLKKK